MKMKIHLGGIASFSEGLRGNAFGRPKAVSPQFLEVSMIPIHEHNREVISELTSVGSGCFE
ncbi:MAG: hypothetical protein A2007_01735 [Verrucomicrobia bacterium GWC2_42_7]|nr:MAG: hypothetical protein A2007_01735 [Verrucomicrobia bacterium GWC2_42_7]